VEGGAPEEQVLEFPGPDISWEAEWREFALAIREDREPLANGYDGWQVMRMVYAIYESARTGRVVRLEEGVRERIALGTRSDDFSRRSRRKSD